MIRLNHLQSVTRPQIISPAVVHRRGYRKYPRGRYQFRQGLNQVKFSLGQPPNFRTQHHFFLPTIKQHLEEIESLRNPININEIGLSHHDFLSRTSPASMPVPLTRKEKRDRAKFNLEQEITSVDDLLQNLTVEEKIKSPDYSYFIRSWYHSECGKEQIIRLAHHYQIFRDLFSSPSLVPTQDIAPEPEVKFPPMNPNIDHLLTDFMIDWYPGTQRYKAPTPREIYQFSPHVPLYVEFNVSESKLATEDPAEWHGVRDSDSSKPNESSLISSPVYRGNLIRPIYCSEKPTVIIDATAGVDDDTNVKSYTDLAGDNQGEVKLLINSACSDKFTLLLLNLDSLFGDDLPLCHWCVSNVSSSSKGQEVITFLPPYGINGLGYHRYVFLLLQHEMDIKLSELSDYKLHERRINLMNLLKEQSAHPVGLSWFQSIWDDWSNKVMHKKLNARAPRFEYIEEAYEKVEQVKYPFAAPFNVYLDHFRDPKEINQQVLMERLASVNPFDYSKQFDVDPLPNAYGELRDLRIPSWQQSSEWKRRNRLGPWRMLRPASARIPHNNNADLDAPFWPRSATQFLPLKYPPEFKHPKPLRDTKWVLPPAEHPHLRIDHEDIHQVNERVNKEFDES